MFRIKTFVCLVLFQGLLLLSFTAGTRAQTITQGYQSDSVIQQGTLVSLRQDDSRTVEPASLDNLDRLHGVVVSQNDAPFTLSTDEEQTFVATTGQFPAFVTIESGPISAGDYIAVSVVTGIGKKANETDQFVVGKALTVFDGVSNILSSQSVGETSYSIGRVVVDIGVGNNPLHRPEQANVPEFLKRIAENIADKEVSPLRVYMSLFVFIMTVVLSGTLLYSGIRSGIISIGRNPLSKKSIVKSLIQVTITGLIILLLGVFAVYLLLRL